LPEQPETDHGDAITQNRTSLAKALKRDGTESRESCGIKVDTFSQDDAEILRNRYEFGMVGVPRTSACHPITRTNALNEVTDLLNGTRATVSERRCSFQSPLHHLVGIEQPLAPDTVKNLLDVFWASPRLLKKSALA